MSRPGYIGALPADRFRSMICGSVPDSLHARSEMMIHAQSVTGVSDPLAAVLQLDGRTRADARAQGRNDPTDTWSDLDWLRLEAEYQFAWNWMLAGRPTFMLAHSTAALLAMTSCPQDGVDFAHAPYPAFLIGVPHAYLPLKSAAPRAIRWIGVESGELMGADGGRLLAIADQETLPQVMAVDAIGRVTESVVPNETDWGRVLAVGIRLAANTIAFVSEHRETPSVRSARTGASAAALAPVFEVLPPSGVVIDREFRTIAAELAAARDFKAAKRAMAHIVRGHWRNQAVGAERSQRRLTWIAPFRRGSQSHGVVVQKVMRITRGEEPSR